jgi:hypothetical protein
LPAGRRFVRFPFSFLFALLLICRGFSHISLHGL